MKFNKDFCWGVGTASYQVEGATKEDGRGESVWDQSIKVKDRVKLDQTGDIACDHYHRYREDVKLLKKLGIKHYRFSISWTRIFPDGIGRINEKGVKFYTDLVDELIKSGITPWVTLFHWDYPQELFYKGGWLNDDSPVWFSDYAEFIVKMFGEKVKFYSIINEPQSFIEGGHVRGGHAPFLKLSRCEGFKVVHNVLKACGLAEKKMRKAAKHQIFLGIASAVCPFVPKTEKDIDIAREKTHETDRCFYSTALFSDPLILGDYPKDVKAWQKKEGFSYDKKDLKIIKSKLDYFGFNCYTGTEVWTENGKVIRDDFNPVKPMNSLGWIVRPSVLYYGVKFMYERYKLPVVISENGICLDEWKTASGNVPDAFRIDYVKEHLKCLYKASKEVKVWGYFYWSFMDNFEWASGYEKRFGLVYVDYETLERTPKDSAYYYKKVIETNGEILFKK